MNTISNKEIKFYAKELVLPLNTIQLLKSGKLTLERISSCSKKDLRKASKRILALDCYKEDYNVELENPRCIEYLLSEAGFAGDGYFLRYGGEDIGYCLIYPVKNENKKDMPLDYALVHKRAKWEHIQNYLEVVFKKKKLGQEMFYHHYDYAIKPLNLRQQGFGKLVLRYTLDNCLPKGCISVGFIDYLKHSQSITSASKAGCVIGEHVFPSPDGKHSSFVELFSKDLSLKFTGKEIGYVAGKDSFSVLPKAIHKVVDAKPKGQLVGFNHSKKRFEIVKARLK